MLNKDTFIISILIYIMTVFNLSYHRKQDKKNLIQIFIISEPLFQDDRGHLDIPREDQTSVCLSINSRKDSGIKSNSRRSSIQQQVQW